MPTTDASTAPPLVNVSVAWTAALTAVGENVTVEPGISSMALLSGGTAIDTSICARPNGNVAAASPARSNRCLPMITAPRPARRTRDLYDRVAEHRAARRAGSDRSAHSSILVPQADLAKKLESPS